MRNLTKNCVSLSADVNLDSQVQGCFIRAYDVPSEELLAYCSSYAYIKHNEGEPHYHLCCRFETKQRVSRVIKLYGSQQNMSIGKLTRGEACVDYLTHKNNPEKRQYSLDEVTSFNIDDLIGSTELTIEKSQSGSKASQFEMSAFLDDLVLYYQKRVSSREMAVRYGRDFIKNCERYRAFGQMMDIEEKAKNASELLANCFGDIDTVSQLVGDYVSNYMMVNGTPPTGDQIREFYGACMKHFENNHPYETEEERLNEIHKSLAYC